MAIEAHDLLRLANTYGAQASDEASRRSTISRAYYASYHRCRRWEKTLPERGRARTPGGVHDRLIQRLRYPNAQCDEEQKERSIAVSKLLEASFDRRISADYELWKCIDEKTVIQQLEATRQVFEQCADPDS